MKIKFKDFKEKSFFIPLNAQGQWSNYKNFTGLHWKQNIINVLRLVIAANNPQIEKSQLNQLAEQQLEMFVNNIRENLSPDRPCLALGFAPAKCWFIAFVVEAFVPLEKTESYNIFQQHYAGQAQTVEIIKAKGDPIQFAFQLINELDN